MNDAERDAIERAVAAARGGPPRVLARIGGWATVEAAGHVEDPSIVGFIVAPAEDLAVDTRAWLASQGAWLAGGDDRLWLCHTSPRGSGDGFPAPEDLLAELDDADRAALYPVGGELVREDGCVWRVDDEGDLVTIACDSPSFAAEHDWPWDSSTGPHPDMPPTEMIIEPTDVHEAVVTLAELLSRASQHQTVTILDQDVLWTPSERTPVTLLSADRIEDAWHIWHTPMQDVANQRKEFRRETLELATIEIATDLSIMPPGFHPTTEAELARRHSGWALTRLRPRMVELVSLLVDDTFDVDDPGRLRRAGDIAVEACRAADRAGVVYDAEGEHSLPLFRILLELLPVDVASRLEVAIDACKPEVQAEIEWRPLGDQGHRWQLPHLTALSVTYPVHYSDLVWQADAIDLPRGIVVKAGQRLMCHPQTARCVVDVNIVEDGQIRLADGTYTADFPDGCWEVLASWVDFGRRHSRRV